MVKKEGSILKDSSFFKTKNYLHYFSQINKIIYSKVSLFLK